jgi:acyl carrier protein
MPLDQQTLITFLTDSLDVADAVDPESELFSSGALDSVAMLSLIAFIEKAGGLAIRPEDVTLENFDTPARILRFAEAQR